MSTKIRILETFGRVGCKNLVKNRFRFKLEKFYHHDYFAPGVCVLFLEPSYFPRTYRSADFCSLLGHFSRVCASNLWQLCYIAALLSFSFSAFFLPTNFLSVVPLLDLFFHLFSRHAPAIAIIVLSKTLPISLHPSSHEYAHCLFYPLRHFYLCFAASCNLQLPFIF